MSVISLLNHVIGPVIRGPSSSHTAGAFHVGAMARSLLGEAPAACTVQFDPGGSYAACFRQQRADAALAAGLLGWAITDERFPGALGAAAEAGIGLEFRVAPIPGADHPNTVQVRLAQAAGRTLEARANSVGGGAVEVTRIGGWPVRFTGDAHETAVEVETASAAEAAVLLARDGAVLEAGAQQDRPPLSLVWVRRLAPLGPAAAERLGRLPGVRHVWTSEPVFFVVRGEAPPGGSAADMGAWASGRGGRLSDAAVEYESRVLGMAAGAVLGETARRVEVMRRSVEAGRGPSPPPMQLLEPSAGRILAAEAAGRVAAGGLATRAAARALAAMHVAAGGGVVVAAPTGGAAGVLPGVLVTLAEERGLDRDGAARALLAAGAVGLVIAGRATFAAEVAGCQVEIGAAGAMGAAAVVEAAGGTARQALDAAAIALQNTMGSVCDLVQGIVEVPCHTRNAAAAAAAFVCADLAMGGYANPVPLDETVDAMLAVGRMLPAELRCTARGGLATAPSARALRPRGAGGGEAAGASGAEDRGAGGEAGPAAGGHP